MSPLSIHRKARQELRDAVIYYRKVSLSAAAEFVDGYEAAIKNILRSPRTNPIILDEYRRKPLRKFPFFLIYTVTGHEVRLLAVAHQSREPLYWFGRG